MLDGKKRGVAVSGIVVLDLETTGFSPHRGDRVIEIGGVAVAHGEIVAEFQTLIRRIPVEMSGIKLVSFLPEKDEEGRAAQ